MGKQASNTEKNIKPVGLLQMSLHELVDTDHDGATGHHNHKPQQKTSVESRYASLPIETRD